MKKEEEVRDHDEANGIVGQPLTWYTSDGPSF